MQQKNKRSTNKTDINSLSKQKYPDEVNYAVEGLQTAYDPNAVIEKARIELTSSKGVIPKVTAESSIFKAMTLSEFNNGTLLVSVVPEMYTTFGINMLRQLQADCGCTQIGDRGTAELAVASYIRMLELNRQINIRIGQEERGKLTINYIAILSKELDRAARQYLSAVQALKMINQPSIQVNIKTNNAVVGQNQLIQNNNV